MTRWKVYQERRRRKKKALQLLTLSGTIRPADVEPRYLGRDRAVGGRYAKAIVVDNVEKDQPPIWKSDLGQLWMKYLCAVRRSFQWQEQRTDSRAKGMLRIENGGTTTGGLA